MLVIFSATLFLLLLVQYSNATLNQDPLQHEEQLPRLFNLVSNNGTQNENVSLLGNHSLAMEHWTKRKSLKTLLINEVAKFHEVEGQDDYGEWSIFSQRTIFRDWFCGPDALKSGKISLWVT
uniref:Uncharacterized protein n=1 Tax=Cacopsylla melanoneura TaxID=428564 RepID=A0A8D8X345_9HEMI